MWHTSAGDRTLEGAEAALIREAIGWVLDLESEAEEPAGSWSFGIPAFDQLAPQQKLALLCEVGEALLRPDILAPNLTALNEATVGVLYEGIRQCLEMEIDGDVPEEFGGPDMRYWRRLVVAALAEAGPTVIERTALPSPDCPDLEKWGLLLETLEGQVLWDADWMDEDLFLDADPDTTAAIKQELDIADDYYTAIAPDPQEPEMAAIRARLRQLVGR